MFSGTLYFFPGLKNPQLVFRNYEYISEKRRAKSTIWRCTGYAKYKCKARVITRGGNVLLKNNHHPHGPSKRNLDACIYSRTVRFTVAREIVTYIQGPRHFSQLVIQDYRYVKHRSSNKSTYWKCHLYDLGVCKARCVVSVNQTVILRGIHSHKPDPNIVNVHSILFQERLKLRNIMKY